MLRCWSSSPFLPKQSVMNTLSSGSTVFGCYAVFIVPALKIYTIIKTTSVDDARLPVVGVASWPVILTGWPSWWAWSKWAWSTHTAVSASQEQTLRGRGAHVYTAHRGWLGVVMGISADSTGSVPVFAYRPLSLASILTLTTSRWWCGLLGSHFLCKVDKHCCLP